MSKTFLDSHAVLWFLRMGSQEVEQRRPSLHEGVVTTVAIVQEAAETLQSIHADADRSDDEIDGLFESAFALCQIHNVTVAAARHALALRARHDLSLLGANMLAAAIEAGAAELYTIALKDGFQCEGVLVRNPFVAERASTSEVAGRHVNGVERLRQLYRRPGFLIRRTHQIYVALFENACAELSLTTSQYTILAVLAARPGVNQTELARMAGLDKVTVSHVTRGLEQRGLLERSYTPTNRRSRVTKLTAEGKVLLEAADPKTFVAYRQLMDALTPYQQQKLLQLLTRLSSRLEPLARTPLSTEHA